MISKFLDRSAPLLIRITISLHSIHKIQPNIYLNSWCGTSKHLQALSLRKNCPIITLGIVSVLQFHVKQYLEERHTFLSNLKRCFTPAKALCWIWDNWELRGKGDFIWGCMVGNTDSEMRRHLDILIIRVRFGCSLWKSAKN